MVNYIHYFIRNISGEKGGLIYPTETQEKNYYTSVSFYIIGEEENKIKNKYVIHAIKEEKIIKLELNRVTTNSFSTSVEDIGTFMFYTENVSMKKYTGTNPAIEGAFILKRLRISSLYKAEEACKKNKFYFIGYSEAING